MYEQGAGSSGIGRFTKTAVLGGLLGGILAAIPLLNLLNCLFCLLVDAGALVGLALYLRDHPGEKISAGEAAASGAISGVAAAVVATILGLIINLLFSGLMAGMLATVGEDLPGAASQLMFNAGGGVVGSLIGLVVSIPIYGGFGALAAFGGLHLFFKDRVAY